MIISTHLHYTSSVAFLTLDLSLFDFPFNSIGCGKEKDILIFQNEKQFTSYSLFFFLMMHHGWKNLYVICRITLVGRGAVVEREMHIV